MAKRRKIITIVVVAAVVACAAVGVARAARYNAMDDSASQQGIHWEVSDGVNGQGAYVYDCEARDVVIPARLSGEPVVSVALSAKALDSLDVTACSSLRYLGCAEGSVAGGHLRTLDLSGCPDLRTLTCYGNELLSLDVSACPRLERLYCYDNYLEGASALADAAPKVEATPQFARPNLSTSILRVGAQVYTGKALTPAVTVTAAGGRALRKGVDFAVTYSNNVNVGTARATVTALGVCKGSKSVSFVIAPMATKLSKVKRAKGSTTAVVKWKRGKGQISGYQIKYGKKTVKVKGAKKTRVKVKRLKAGKKYKFKIRTYKKVGGKVYYSAWSKVKKK